jgi:hypothetical protein
MPRRSKDGNYILSAGEIGSFVVCPEAWRLRMVERVHITATESVQIGKKLHAEWVRRFDQATYLRFGSVIILGLMIMAIGLHLLLR